MRSYFERLYSSQLNTEAGCPASRKDLAQALRAQQLRGFGELRFNRHLETAFRDYLAESGRQTRIGMFLLLASIVATVPSFSTHILHEPADFARYAHPIIYSLVPVMLAGAFMAWYRPLSVNLDRLCIAVFAAASADTLLLRSIGEHFRFAMPLEWVALATTALVIAAHVRFRRLLPWVILVALATVANECLLVNATPGDYYRLFILLLLMLIVCVGGYSLEHFIRRTWVSNCLLDYVSSRDDLTDLLNRNALEQATRRLIAHARREHQAFALAMIDIDDFKRYNDTHGHRAGDLVLRRVASVLREATRRPQDFCGRYGGEEFALAWVGGGYDELCTLAERLRKNIEQSGLTRAAPNVTNKVTVSIGLYWVGADEVSQLAGVLDKAPAEGAAPVFEAADRLLYQAKDAGRNRVIHERASRHDVHTIVMHEKQHFE